MYAAAAEPGGVRDIGHSLPGLLRLEHQIPEPFPGRVDRGGCFPDRVQVFSGHATPILQFVTGYAANLSTKVEFANCGFSTMWTVAGVVYTLVASVTSWLR